MTHQRQIILEAVKECGNHPNAAEIYDKVREKHSVSLATVYNSLNYLSENGLIKRVEISGEVDRYDHNTFEHYHAKCDNCGQIYDIAVRDIIDSLQQEYKFKVTSVNLHCVCKNCLNS